MRSYLKKPAVIFLFALPAGALLAEGIACGIVLVSKHMLLGQTIFDLMAAACFYVVMGKYQTAYRLDQPL